MALILFAPDTCPQSHALRGIVHSVISPQAVQPCRTHHDLLQALRQPGHIQPIVILVIPTGEDLKNIMALAELLADVRIIMILPAHDRQTIAQAHALGPRYISFLDGDFQDVEAVLRKMAGSPLGSAADSNCLPCRSV